MFRLKFGMLYIKLMMCYILTYCINNANYMLHQYQFFNVETNVFFLPFIVLYIFYTFFYLFYIKYSKCKNHSIITMSSYWVVLKNNRLYDETYRQMFKMCYVCTLRSYFFFYISVVNFFSLNR